MTGSNGHIIVVKDLVKRFGHFVANDHLTFNVDQGEVFGFLGANGAGKTTAIRILCGLLAPTSGSATIAGFDVYRQTDSIKRSIGYMSQKFTLYEDMTVRENFRFFGGIYGMREKAISERLDFFLEKLDMASYRDTVIEELPLGWKQKIAFSIAIIHKPAIVFLDEPTSGVDPITRRQFWEMIYDTARQKITVFITTHYMDEAEYCDRATIMVAGKIEALDTPSKLKEKYQAKTMQEVFIKIAGRKS